MRLLLATNHSYLPQRTGGSEVSTHELATALRRRGERVAVQAGLEAKGLTWRVNRALAKLTRFVAPALPYAGYPVHRSWDPVQAAPAVAKLFRPQMVIVQAGQPALLANAFQDLGVPVALYVRDVGFHDFGGALRRPEAVCFISNSAFTAGRLRERLGRESLIVPPLVDATRYRCQGPHDEVLFVNPIPAKGLDRALALAARFPQQRFRFVESWPLNDSEWRRVAEPVSRLPNVILQRQVADMRPLYARARVLLVPSLVEEAWGRVASEAQCSGVPVLATAVGGLPEAVGPGGLLLPPEAGDDAWAEALASLLQDAARYAQLSAAARRHADRPDFQPDLLLERLLQGLRGHLGHP